MESDRLKNYPCDSDKKISDCDGRFNIEDSLETEELSVDPNTIKDFIKHFDKTQLLVISAALQLCIKNYGKNSRLEQFTDEILRIGIKKNYRDTTYEDIQEFFEKHLRFDHMEDPTVNHFIENIIFFGGNYRVMPGINVDSTEILNGFLESIFTIPNNLSEVFKEKVRHASLLLLLISEDMIRQTGLSRYSLEDEDNDDPIYVPELSILDDLLSSVRFEMSYLKKTCSIFKIPVETINEFLINGKDLGENYDPYESPLLSYPLYESENEIICLIPSTLSKALSDYIKNLASEMTEEEFLFSAYHNWQWHKFRLYAKEMEWLETDIQLPEAASPERFIEGVFQIDQDKLAYAQYSKRTAYPTRNTTIPKSVITFEQKQETINERNTVVCQYLNTLENEFPLKVLTLFIIGGIGNNSMHTWNKPIQDNHTLLFSFFDFEKIIFDGELEPLSLWKFAKAYGRAAKTTRFMPSASALDSYVLYLENEGSLLPYDTTPDLYYFMGVGTDFHRRVVKFRDEHSARRYVNNKFIDVPVRRSNKYAPIYKLQQQFRENVRLIESFVFPCWITNEQARNIKEHRQIGFFTEAVAFWLLKLGDVDILKGKLNNIGIKPVEIQLELDKALLTNISVDDLPSETLHDQLEFTIEERVIILDFPSSLITLLIKNDNRGERLIMKTVLNGFNILLKKNGKTELKEDEIEQIFNEVMSLQNAKMILMGNIDQNPLLDKRGLDFRRHLYGADQALVNDYLIPNLGLKKPIPETITSTEEKNKLCLTIVDSLINQISNKIASFEILSLIRWLMLLNESLIQEDAENDIRLPHQLACFGDFPSAVADLQKKNRKIIPTALACRCLIEFVAAAPPSGSRPINLDEMDELIALMNEVIRYANIADSIDLKLNDPEMGLLSSGRLYVSHDFFTTYIKPFNLARTESLVYSMLHVEKNNMSENDGEILVNNRVTDKAFFEEWGVTLTTLTAIYGNLIKIGMAAGKSFMTLEEKEFLVEIQKDFAIPVPEQELINGLQLLSIERRDSLNKAPIGYNNKDIMPWRFNRALSYNRRPLVKIKHTDESVQYYWGFRHVLKSYDALTSLITSGRLVVKEGGPIEKDVLTLFRHRKGKRYRQQVFSWLKTNTSLEIIDYEVTIHETGVLIADRNYGDVDIMAIDQKQKILYSIECKNTVTARVIHEMKTELDNYLGRDGRDGHIQKHLNRDTWLKSNKDQLVKFVEDPKNYEIHSIILTSNIIPVLYLAKNKSALPIFSFPDLVRNGFNIIA